VHLNGRVYDPLLARFTSADPTVTDPLNPQGWNRYSYVGNDPLAFTDPNGFSWLSGFFNAIGNFFSGIVRSITNFLVNNTIARAILQIGLNVLLGPVGAAIGAAIVAGLAGGNLGQILKAGLIAGVTAFAFQGIGPAPSFAAVAAKPVGFGAYIGESALVGCASSAASGGSCKSGALAAAVGAGLSRVTTSLFPNAASDIGQRVEGTIFQATAGGLASVAGGGKFANGAITGAFQYLASTSLESAKQNPLDADSQSEQRDPLDANAMDRDDNGNIKPPQINPLDAPGVNPLVRTLVRCFSMMSKLACP